MESTTTANIWSFAPNSVTVNGQTFPASYSIAKEGDVYVYTALRAAADAPEMPVRVHISAAMPMYAEAVAAAQSAKEKPAPEANPAPKANPAPTDKPAPAKRSHKSKGIRRPEVPAPVQDKPSAPAEKPAPVQDKPAGAPVEKPWIGTTITGKGWNIAFDGQAGRTRVLFQAQPSAAQKAAIESAGFYWSGRLNSWNKGLTCKAYRATQSLAVALIALA